MKLVMIKSLIFKMITHLDNRREAGKRLSFLEHLTTEKQFVSEVDLSLARDLVSDCRRAFWMVLEYKTYCKKIGVAETDCDPMDIVILSSQFLSKNGVVREDLVTFLAYVCLLYTSDAAAE